MLWALLIFKVERCPGGSREDVMIYDGSGYRIGPNCLKRLSGVKD